MKQNTTIVNVLGREILDSRGNPTVEACVTLADGTVGFGVAPSGASTGEHEALELRDTDNARYKGKGVAQAVCNINLVLSPLLEGKDASDLYTIDHAMIEADGTKDKSNIGANAILAVSIAVAKAAAKSYGMPLHRFLGGVSGTVLPIPMMNILNGGRHAANTVDFQEFMIMPVGAANFHEALRMGTEIYHTLKAILEKNGLSTAVGDEGGFAPDLKNAEEVFDYLSKAVEEAGFVLGADVVFAMDAAASELYNRDSGLYVFEGEGRRSASTPDTYPMAVSRSTDVMIEYYKKLCAKYPIRSIEDALDENDWEGWRKLTTELGDQVQLVGDDLFVTNTKRLMRGIKEGCGNSILIKPNQIGTLSETMEAIRMAKGAGYTAVVSHRSGETEDTTIADLAVALNCGQIKTGAPCRSERVAKYNQLLRIEEHLGNAAKVPALFGRKTIAI